MIHKLFSAKVVLLGFVIAACVSLQGAIGQSIVPGEYANPDGDIRYFTQDIILELVHDYDVDTRNDKVLSNLSRQLAGFFVNLDYSTFYQYMDRMIRRDDTYKLGGSIVETIGWLKENKAKLFSDMKIDTRRYYKIKSGTQYHSFIAISMNATRLNVDSKSLDFGLMVLTAGIACGGPYKITTVDKNQFIISGVSLNWITVSQMMIGMITGGPGGLPVQPGKPVIEKDYSITGTTSSSPFAPYLPAGKYNPLLDPNKKPAPFPVDIFILDTIPRLSDIDKAYGAYGTSNPVFKNIMDSMGIRHSLRFYDCGDPDFGGYMNEKYGNRNLSDHGIFIAGIANLVSPASNLHLIEVMNRCAAGTFDSLFWGFCEALNAHATDKPFIVNTSLTTKLRFPGEKEDPPEIGDDIVVKMIYGCPDTGMYLTLLEHIVSLIEARNGLIVSAAGNDSNARFHYDAGYPARLKSVMSVGSSRRDGYISSFSNLPGPNGFLAFGGEIDTLGKTKDGLLSVYISDPYTDSMDPNVSGWGRWAGSSFATGLVSGVMAVLLSEGYTITDAKLELKASCDASTGFPVVPVKQGP